jgi:dolichyl-phosphate beta-glucosyltransferase
MKLAIIVPCFNEEERFNLSIWNNLINEVQDCLWIFVDDGSLDSTLALLNALKKDEVHILKLKSNLGKGEAVRAGFNYLCSLEESSKCDRIGFLDSDCAFSISDVIAMEHESRLKLVQASKYRTLIGSRVKLAGRNIQRNLLRHYLGRIITTYICFGWRFAPYDTQSGFKIFRLDSEFMGLMSAPFTTRWFFDIEILIRLQTLKSNEIWELPLDNWKDIKGSKITFKSFFSILMQIIAIKKIVRENLRERGVNNGLN